MYGGELPFTGSLLTFPLVLVGLALSVAAWLLGFRSHDEAPD
jgi:hypothetical protein